LLVASPLRHPSSCPARRSSDLQLQETQLDSDVTIDSLLTDMKAALDEVRSQASTFGSNLSIVQNRKSFTTAMIDTLETGAGNLTDRKSTRLNPSHVKSRMPSSA